MQGNALNATGICSSSSAHRRFQEWEQAGVFDEIWRKGLLEYHTLVGIDWAWVAADGAMTKAPLGGPKTGPNPTDRAKKVRNVRFSARERGPDRAGARRPAPQRPAAPRTDPREHPDRAARAEAGAAARLCLDRGYDSPPMHALAIKHGSNSTLGDAASAEGVRLLCGRVHAGTALVIAR